MEYIANEGKKIEISVGNDVYIRHVIQTRFVKVNDNYIDIVKDYASEIYEPGDILSISEKIISICQNRIIKRENIQIGIWAKFLSRFACKKNRGGYGVGDPINMQYAIDKAGLLCVIFASILSGITKLFGIKGVFYKIAGQEVKGLDGFYDGAWKEYRNIGIEIPENPTQVCNEIKEQLGISCMIIDANDFEQEILGKSQDIEIEEAILKQLIQDNPAGQGRERTPLILIRKIN